MLDRSDPPALTRDTPATPTQPAVPTAATHLGQPTEDTAKVPVAGPARGVLAPLVGGMTAALAASAGAGPRVFGVLVTGTVAVLVGMVLVAAILVAGFTYAMITFAAEGRRRASSVEDVDTLMTGTASAYGQVFTRFTALVRGTTGPRPRDRTRHVPTAR